MRQEIVAAFMTQPPYCGAPAVRAGGSAMNELTPEQVMTYVKPWHISVNRLGLRGTILYDQLPPGAVEALTTPHVSCLRIAPDGVWNSYDRRWPSYRKYLADNPDLERVYFTDINDVGVMADPFAWWDRLGVKEDRVLVGREWARFTPNKWIEEGLARMHPKYTEALVTRLGHERPLNCGILAGHRGVMLRLLDAMVPEMREARDWILARDTEVRAITEMFVLNRLLYEEFGDRLVTFQMESGYDETRILLAPSPFQHDRESALMKLRLQAEPGQATWKDVSGWFDFQQVYDEEVARANNGDVLVEVGAYLGKSAAYLATGLKAAGKKVSFVCVDTWQGSGGADPEQDELIAQAVAAHGGDLYSTFMQNMRAVGVEQLVRPLRKASVEAAGAFYDGTVDFVYIDAAHDYGSVKADIAAWLPKLKHTGVMAGHDWGMPEVARAVREAFGDRVQVLGPSWVVRTPHGG